MKRVLIIEDNYGVLEENQALLKANGYTVTLASSTDRAEQSIEKAETNPFDCLIIDLNMSNEFLDDGLRKKTHGGSLTGWVWLYNIAKPKLHNNPKIIIYSEFLIELDEEMKNSSEEEREYKDSFVTIAKADAVNGVDILLNKVNEVFRK